MKTYVVGYINFFNNELTLEQVKANDPCKAIYKHSELATDAQHFDSSMSLEDIQDALWSADSMVAVIEVT